ncbi:MAG TPA: deoxyuridine 5'-triphosphate nucleotidohydrolase [Methanothermococcus okinawensis]|uniref:Deoxyuridine 5'-triphosphate nucleotidohydrolase n=1 Tax=Methanothermococcus okinawensis TaxID=155863 RepID=A0A832ZAI6_9EURY|nr:deoxyuridine 5'-triphosphate nucleotidohydrolase [Methanothermococcus okinawensis]HIP90840.1 deoxyuridine 5'-triphosphate nucleotidohydrolase [Methanothermococcus okinawensis]
MIIGPKISRKFVKVVDDTQVQQCGIDLRVGKIFKIEGEGVLDYSNEKRKLPQYREIFSSQEDIKISLDMGVYLIKVADRIEVPRDTCALVYPRSSLLRMGCTLHTAVHDPGYEGYPEYLLDVKNPITLYRYARIAQILFIRCSGVVGTYCGIYQRR